MGHDRLTGGADRETGNGCVHTSETAEGAHAGRYSSRPMETAPVEFSCWMNARSLRHNLRWWSRAREASFTWQGPGGAPSKRGMRCLQAALTTSGHGLNKAAAPSWSAATSWQVLPAASRKLQSVPDCRVCLQPLWRVLLDASLAAITKYVLQDCWTISSNSEPCHSQFQTHAGHVLPRHARRAHSTMATLEVEYARQESSLNLVSCPHIQAVTQGAWRELTTGCSAYPPRTAAQPGCRHPAVSDQGQK